MSAISSGEIIPPLSGHYRTGDFIVGGYNDNGTRIAAGELMGNEEAKRKLQEKFRRHVQAQGGTFNPKPTGKLKKQSSTSQAGTAQPKATGSRKARKQTAAKIVDPMSETPDTYDQGHSSSTNYTTKSPEKRSVSFISALGKIKVNVLGILECPGGVGLVFESEDDIAFEPAPGEQLTIKFDEEEREVFYPGLMFSWFTGEIRVMIFLNSEGQE